MRLALSQCRLGLADAQQRPHRGQHLLGFDGLRQIPVGLAFQAADAILARDERCRGLQHQEDDKR